MDYENIAGGTLYAYTLYRVATEKLKGLKKFLYLYLWAGNGGQVVEGCCFSHIILKKSINCI